ncbi:hypothetical protein MCBRY_000704 [Methylocystis bryophila]
MRIEAQRAQVRHKGARNSGPHATAGAGRNPCSSSVNWGCRPLLIGLLIFLGLPMEEEPYEPSHSRSSGG